MTGRRFRRAAADDDEQSPRWGRSSAARAERGGAEAEHPETRHFDESRGLFIGPDGYPVREQFQRGR